MNGMQVVRLVALREVRERIRTKGFLISTAITMLVVVGISVLPAVLSDDGPTTYEVGLAAGDPIGDRLPLVADALDDVEVEVREVAGAGDAERRLDEGDLDAAVVDGRIVVAEELGDELALLLQEANRQVTSEGALAGAGLDPGEVAAALAPPALEVRALDPPEEDEGREQIVFVGTILLYGQLFGFGFYVANGIVEEKTSRVVELLLAKAGPSLLLTGKIIGIGVVGFVQLVAIVVVGLVAASAAGSVDLPPEIVRVAIEVLIWFVLGYAFYACCFAVAGALASKPEEIQNTTAPLTMVVVASFFAAIAAGGDPGGTVATVASFLPPSAPLVLPIRSAAGELPLWQLLLSVAIVLVSIVAAVRFAARIYGGGALHTRGQLKLRQALAGPR